MAQGEASVDPLPGVDGVLADRVVIGPVIVDNQDPWEDRQSRVAMGSIRQLDSHELVMVTSDGQALKVASDRVERVVINWAGKEAQAAMQLLGDRKYREAIAAIEQALGQGVPRWQGRFMVEGIVQAALGLGSPRVAGIIFLQNLATASPPSLLYAEMPLCWTAGEVDAQLQEKAKEWLFSDEEHAELLGASWLLFSSQAPAAQEKLRELQSSDNQSLAQLAVAQAWRLVPPPSTMSELPGWYKFRDGLRPALQLGPTEFIADRLMRIGQTDLAIGQWLRIASQHGDRYHRALPAMQQALQLLEREGRTEAAQRLKEWIERLAKT